MYIQERKIKICLIVFSTFFMLLVLNVFLEREIRKSDVCDNETVKKFCEEGEVVLGIYSPTIGVQGEKTDIIISCWQGSEENVLYLFLPSGSFRKEFFWVISEENDVNVESVKVKTGDKFNSLAGDYQIVIENESGKKECLLKVMESSSVASLFIETESGNLEYIHEQKGNEERGSYIIFSEAGFGESVGLLESIRGRGNVSWVDSEKKSYQITIETKKALLGMPVERQWILVPNAFDDTLLKSKICYDIAYGMGLAYTPECQYVDCYINGEYRGNYLLSEKVEIGENRVAIYNLEKENETLNPNIETLEKFNVQTEKGGALKGSMLEKEPEEISGGYLMELETEKRFENEESGFITERGQRVTMSSPKYASFNQVSYIAERYQCFENAIYSEDGYCPYDGKKFTEYIDLESFAKKYLVEELSKNFDASITSQYIYKPESSVSDKFFAGPVWDYDKSLGIEEQNRVGMDLKMPEGIHAGTQEKEYDIWYGLYQQKEFKEEVYNIFEKELEWIVKKEIRYTIPETAKKIKKSMEMNLVRWNVYNGLSFEDAVKKYDERVEEVCDFIERRMDYLEEEWGI